MVDTIPNYSTNGLLMMHRGIQEALTVDDSLPERSAKPYGVRDYSDWHRWADAIESELDKRNIKYTKIDW